MTPLQAPPPPPVGEWERIKPAAQNRGLPVAPTQAHIEAGLAHVRVARLGKRGLLHVASADMDALAQRLACGAQR